jgi:quercetin dioxygenase-like cupin family protein
MMRLSTGIAMSFLLASSVAYSQQPAPKITPLLEAPITGQPNKELVLVSVEWPAGSTSPPHTHPGDEYGTVLSGVYAIRQGNGAWKTYTVGQSWHMPAGVVHEGKTETAVAKTMHAYVVEKGKPLIVPFTKP